MGTRSLVAWLVLLSAFGLGCGDDGGSDADVSEVEDGPEGDGDGAVDEGDDSHAEAEVEDVPDDGATAEDFVEEGPACPAGCLIDSVCYGDGEVAADNPCLICDPDADLGDWSFLPAGTSCDDGRFCNGSESCDGAGTCAAEEDPCPAADGSCVGGCDEDIDACTPAEAGTVCRTVAGSCDLEEVCDGAALECPADEVLEAGAICRPAVGPCDLAETCNGAAPDCPADEVLAAGTACDDGNACSSGDACDGAGACVGTTFAAPGPFRSLLPQNGALLGRFLGAPLRPHFQWVEPYLDGCPAPTYDLQVDDSCPASGFPLCSFASPELDVTGWAATDYNVTTDLPVSATAPVGRRYYWRVRACRGTACSAWTAVRHFDLGRVPQDVNGDGYSDVAVGAPVQDAGSTDEGNVFVYYGSPTGLPSAPSVILDSPTGEAGAGFGQSVALTDLEGDGFADLIAGAPAADRGSVDEGNAYVYRGGAAGLPTAPTQVLDSPSGQASAFFADELAAAGDVDGDGRGDLVVGCLLYDGTAVDQGAAYVYLGAAAGVLGSPVVLWLAPVPEAGAQFGRAVAGVGDLDGDGYADVAVGAPFQDGTAVDEGAVYVYRGGPAGPSAVPDVVLSEPSHQAGAHFGRSVASAGDINVNGFSELLVGVPQRAAPELDEGNVHIYYGGPSVLLTTTPTGTFDSPLDAAGSFGFAVAGVGDVNGDVNPDIVLGAPDASAPASREGNAYVFHGCYCGVIHTAPATTMLDNPDDQAGALFGQAVSGAGDVNGDGFADLVVGAWAHTGTGLHEGFAFVYHGSLGGLPTVPTLRLANPAGQAGGFFGGAVD
ncbi:MAG: FG-GAP repeat protein [Deltaproteobacteria bacterium]|nr:FG-GAP repeat protein [Deltaproteobacteria bacterium]